MMCLSRYGNANTPVTDEYFQSLIEEYLTVHHPVLVAEGNGGDASHFFLDGWRQVCVRTGYWCCVLYHPLLYRSPLLSIVVWTKDYRCHLQAHWTTHYSGHPQEFIHYVSPLSIPPRSYPLLTIALPCL